MMLPSQIIKQTPVVGSVYGFYRTASRVYDSTSPAGAVKEALKGLVIDCTPQVPSALCVFINNRCCLYSYWW